MPEICRDPGLVARIFLLLPISHFVGGRIQETREDRSRQDGSGAQPKRKKKEKKQKFKADPIQPVRDTGQAKQSACQALYFLFSFFPPRPFP